MDHFSIFRSELKVKVLLALLTGEKKIADFRSEIPQSRDTTILHILEEFETLKKVEKNQNTYRLTSMGLMEANTIKEFADTLEVIEKFKDLWLLHEVRAIPTKLLLTLGKLKDSEVVETEVSDLGAVYQKFVDLAKRSKTLHGTSPIFHPDFILLIGYLLSQGNMIELIVTKAVLRKILGLVDSKVLSGYVERGLLKLYIKDDLKVALAVTDQGISLGLLTLSGKYDDSMDMISFSKEAIEWGEQLFYETLKMSKFVTSRDLLEYMVE